MVLLWNQEDKTEQKELEEVARFRAEREAKRAGARCCSGASHGNLGRWALRSVSLKKVFFGTQPVEDSYVLN